MSDIMIYTDGSSLGNPGPGGYGIVMKYKQHRKEMAKGFRKTTNNRMELLAVIAALESLKKEGLKVTIFSDSKYVVNAIEQKWVWGWEKKHFKNKKNEDLWRRFLKIYPKFQVNLKWVKGHAGHPENERCDRLAVAAAQGNDLFIDTGYESMNQ